MTVFDIPQQSTEALLSVAEIASMSDELEELRLFRRRTEAVWTIVHKVGESIGGDMTVSPAPGVKMDLSCSNCARVISILMACVAIMEMPISTMSTVFS